jgi:hypothetical protein
LMAPHSMSPPRGLLSRHQVYMLDTFSLVKTAAMHISPPKEHWCWVSVAAVKLASCSCKNHGLFCGTAKSQGEPGY